MAHKILEEAQEMNDLLIKWRRDLHQIPETDLELPKTVEYISKRLDEMNVEYKVFPEVSVIIAQIGKGDKCFLLRSDMDALPVEEETGLEFASKNGCMHGCGHDLHATILLGATKILKEHEEELPGVVKLLFQPGEETFRGAKAAVEAGVLENPHVDAAFAAQYLRQFHMERLDMVWKPWHLYMDLKSPLQDVADTVLHRRVVLTRSTLV